jgi:hypothetical protein
MAARYHRLTWLGLTRKHPILIGLAIVAPYWALLSWILVARVF